METSEIRNGIQWIIDHVITEDKKRCSMTMKCSPYTIRTAIYRQDGKYSEKELRIMAELRSIIEGRMKLREELGL